jgi:hypothetical protein
LLILDVENPLFFEYLENCSRENLELLKIENENINLFQKIIKKSLKLFFILNNVVKLFLLEPITTEKEWEIIF